MGAHIWKEKGGAFRQRNMDSQTHECSPVSPTFSPRWISLEQRLAWPQTGHGALLGTRPPLQSPGHSSDLRAHGSWVGSCGRSWFSRSGG